MFLIYYQDTKKRRRKRMTKLKQTDLRNTNNDTNEQTSINSFSLYFTYDSHKSWQIKMPSASTIHHSVIYEFDSAGSFWYHFNYLLYL